MVSTTGQPPAEPQVQPQAGQPMTNGLGKEELQAQAIGKMEHGSRKEKVAIGRMASGLHKVRPPEVSQQTAHSVDSAKDALTIKTQ